MQRFDIRRPSPALIISVISLFIATSGVGYAAATIGSSQIKNNSVRGKDIRNSTIGGKDVAKNALTGSDIAESKLGKVPSATNATNAQNASLAANAAPGAIGAGELGKVVVRALETQIADGGVDGKTVPCAAGEKAIGGGGRFVGLGGKDLAVFSSGPDLASGEPTNGGEFNAWRSTAQNATAGDTPGNAKFTSYAVCLQP